MAKKGFFRWFTLDMLVFIALNVYLVVQFGDRLSVIGDIGYFKLLILGLAAYRAANIVSNEPVTKPLRAPFVDEEKINGKIIEEPKRKGFLGAMGTLLYCPSCTGVWLSAALVYFYIFFPTPAFVISLLLALSAIERIVSAFVGKLKR